MSPPLTAMQSMDYADAFRVRPDSAWPPAIGRIKRLRLSDGSEQRYFLYVPRSLQRPVRLLISVHGISRNAREHAELFAPLAERWGVVLAAPHFGRKRNPGYQRLSPDIHQRRPDDVLQQIAADIGERLGVAQRKYFLFGYSGGGQFVHRYAMMHPERVAAMAIGAAGWFTLPDNRLPYPLGLQMSEDSSITADSAFLNIPTAVLVGSRDVERDGALNQSRRIDRSQGTNRFERGLRWTAAMQAAALRRGLKTAYRFFAVPGVGHDFADAMTTGQMGSLAMSFLLGDPPQNCSAEPQA